MIISYSKISLSAALGDGIDHFNSGLNFCVDCSPFPPQGKELKRSNCPDSTSPEPPVMGTKSLDSFENFVFDHPTLNHVHPWQFVCLFG